MDVNSYFLPIFFLSGWIIFWSFCYAAPHLYPESITKQFRASTDSVRAHRQFHTIALLATLMHFAGFWNITPIGFPDSLLPPIPQGAVLVIFTIGILLAMLAAWNIRFLTFHQMVFSISPRKVSGGPYKIIRHPMYAGLATALFGFLLAYPTIIGAVSLVAIVCIFSVRASAEVNDFSASDDADLGK